MARSNCLLAVGLFLLSGCATHSIRPVDEAITVSRRPWFAICAGVCPDYDVTVWSDGRVKTVRRHLDVPDEVNQFRVSRHRAATFGQIVAPLRNLASQTASVPCAHNVSKEEAPLVMNVAEIEIRWPDARITACANESGAAALGAIKRSLEVVRLREDGWSQVGL
jgi:hypothetical protein